MSTWLVRPVRLHLGLGAWPNDESLLNNLTEWSWVEIGRLLFTPVTNSVEEEHLSPPIQRTTNKPKRKKEVTRDRPLSGERLKT